LVPHESKALGIRGFEMTWHGRIVTTPNTLFGKPRIAGTRIDVDFVLDLLASAWSEAKVLGLRQLLNSNGSAS